MTSPLQGNSNQNPAKYDQRGSNTGQLKIQSKFQSGIPAVPGSWGDEGFLRRRSVVHTAVIE